jgi:lantibiotic modifying enzyme
MREERWSPILEDGAGEAALAVAHDIALALAASSRPAATPDLSLHGGDAGEALFFAYLALAFPGEGHEEAAARRLERAIAALADQPTGPTLCEGFAGVAWATTHLQGLLDLDAFDADPNEEMDRALVEILAPAAPQLPCELLHGLAGIGVYFVEREPRASASPGLARVVDRLEASFVQTPRGLAWAEASRHDNRSGAPEGEPRFSLGLSRGVPGVVAFLAHALAHGVEPRRTQRLLDGAVTWLLSQRSLEAGPVAFPSFVTRTYRAPGNTPTAWCGGDPGVAAALLAAARAAHRMDWERAALDIALLAARRPVAEAGVVDAGLCHGASGVALVFARLFRSTGEPALKAAAVRWFEHALALRRPGRGIAGFQSWMRVDDGGKRGSDDMCFAWGDDASFLTGVAGIGLALLAAATHVEPAWDIVLLLRPPSARADS